MNKKIIYLFIVMITLFIGVNFADVNNLTFLSVTLNNTKYEKLCDDVYETKDVYTSYSCINKVPYNISCRTADTNKDYCLIDSICTNVTKQNVLVGCVPNGKVRVNDSKVISYSNYNCGIGVCDEYKDNLGGGGDGNGDGICQPGETCVKY